MADDTTDTPTPAATPAKPTTRRRAAPRKTAGAKPATKRAAKPAAEKPASESAAAKPATRASASTTKPARAKPGPKPGTKRTATPKPRSSSRPASTATRRKPATAAGTASHAVETVKDKVGGGWGLAATVAGGIAAVGAVGAALFSLRGSTPKPAGKKAHTADGSNASKSFEAGIADENTIPDKS